MHAAPAAAMNATITTQIESGRDFISEDYAPPIFADNFSGDPDPS
jgi:hypothetical protein